jgi:hypothetical protein
VQKEEEEEEEARMQRFETEVSPANKREIKLTKQSRESR